MPMHYLRNIITSCAAALLCMAAQAASLNLGYCYGAIAEKGISKVGNATISGAVILTPEMLAPYQGTAVTGVRVGLVTAEGVENLSGWIRSSLDGENLDSGTADATEGWNEVPLSGGVLVDGQPLAVGFSFNQQKSVKCISLTGRNKPDGKWIAKNGKWEEASAVGVLSVELVVSGDNLPEKDLAIVAVDAPTMPVKEGEDITINLGLRNLALSDIEGVDLVCDIDGETQTTQSLNSLLPYGTLLEVPVTIEASALTPDVAHMLTIKAVCDGDGNLGNEVITLPVGSYTQSFERRVLVEEFTSEHCPNCPRGINTLEQCHNAGYGDRMTVVAHHVGYADDWLTLDEDRPYTWFYDPEGTEGTYAPAVMLDRTAAPDAAVPVRSIGYFNDFEPQLTEALAVPAFVSLDAFTSYEAECGMLNVTVDAECLPIFPVASPEPRISVYVIEDGIKAHDQAGISSDSFTHSHVYRKMLTETWGDVMDDFTDNKARMFFSCNLDPEWVTDNLSIVAFIHNYDANDVKHCNVLNSTVAKVSTSGIEDITASEIVKTEYYTLTGLRLDAPAPGICLRRTISADGSIVTDKVVITE